jgi:hypothetical protein
MGNPAWRDECKKAYVIAGMLTGVSQLVALICAPVFGFAERPTKKVPMALLVAAGAGVLGYTLLGARKLDLSEDGHVLGGAFIVVAFLGFSQIGAIVCSLALLARAVHDTHPDSFGSDLDSDDATTLAASSGEEGDDVTRERSPLLGQNERVRNRAHLKGSMAGVYSLAGGAGILILTKLGGWLFDEVGWGWPFYMMAGFNGVLLLVGCICAARGRRHGDE